MSRSKSTGLVSKSSHPAASAFSREPDMACAVRAMIGMSYVAGLFLSRRDASQPSTTGRSRSIRITDSRQSLSRSLLGHLPPPAVRSRRVIRSAISACKRCRRCPRHREFWSRGRLRHTFKVARLGHEAAKTVNEIGRLERFLQQDRFDPGIEAGAILRAEIKRSNDNNGNAPPLRMLLQCCHKLESVHFRHHEIEDDNVGHRVLQTIKRGTAILGFHYQPLRRLKPIADAPALRRSGLADKPLRRPGRCSIAPDDLDPLVTIERLCGGFDGSHRPPP